MKVPKPRKLSSGKWFIQLRLGGENINVANLDRKACIREAAAIKASYMAGKRVSEKFNPGKISSTLSEAIDKYIEARDSVLSPVTIRGYRIIQKHRFASVMDRQISSISPDDWQGIVNAESKLCAPKTLTNAYKFVKTVYEHETGEKIKEVSIPCGVPSSRTFLLPDEIKALISAVKDDPVYAVPTLLALSSLRISEIQALRWENIPENPKFIRVSGAVVFNEHNEYVRKAANKNINSSRNVPILIPELREAIERDRKPLGPVLSVTQNSFREYLRRLCPQNKLPIVSPHGLRHTFASLAYHLQIPERITMEIGGWSNPATMHKIYTHVAKADIERYEGKLSDFFSTC